MEDKDPRYSYVRSVWKAGDLKSFDEIFRIVPKSIIATDLHLNYERFSTKVQNLRKLSLREIENLSILIGIPFRALLELVLSGIASANPKDQNQPSETT
ncbi:hypothetical protein EDB95_4995 [Dinghuibacter silviterrae]|uniref:Cro/C1-type helix-turn-helix DNA-binding protein n=1 Tax=Dinghuibacter silviterrae TaxID=1539049 RepID=A0A4R8DHF9_9BACT|nr:hypothetical protein EDB95_4995 [Dinghuibacter silviterrae]